MYYKEPPRSRRYVKMLDPACAICRRSPGGCDCEKHRLDEAVRDAERKIMKPVYTQVQDWVRRKAQDHILEYFHLLTEKRKIAHVAHIEHLHMHARHHHNLGPHPQALVDADHNYQQGINDDWAISVNRYPEVLAYFYNLVELSLPSDDDPAVRSPPLTGLSSAKKQHQQRRRPSMPPQIAQVPYQHHPSGPSPRTPEPGRRQSYRNSNNSFHRERDLYYT